jgi:adhesin/invasin
LANPNSSGIDAAALDAVSCASASFCAAVDSSGNVLTSTDPTGGAAAWTSASIDSNGLTGVSCPSASLCVAVDSAGNVVVGSGSSVQPDHFRVTVPTTTETSGESFPVTVTALDASNHVLTGYGGPVTLTDTSGSVSTVGPILWSGGVGTAMVSVGTAISRDRVTATDSSFTPAPTGTSTNVFAVTSPVLNHFHPSTLPTTVSTGDQIMFQVTALDAGSQVITGFSGPLSLTDTTGTLNVVSVSWAAGVATVTASVGAASTRDRITVASGSVSAVTTVFNVLGPVASLRVSVSPTTSVTQSTAATVTVTAVDSAGQVVTGFAGPLTLTDSSGAMQVLSPGSWLAGVDTETVSFPKTITRDRVTASDGNGHGGQSAVFAVVPSGGTDPGNV